MFPIKLSSALTSRLMFRLANSNGYATVAIPGVGKTKKKIGKMGALIEKRVHPVETDAKKLTSHLCGSNIMKEGEDTKLGEDSEYPDWLWNLSTEKPPAIEEMDKESKAYWIRVRKMSIVRHNKLRPLKQLTDY